MNFSRFHQWKCLVAAPHTGARSAPVCGRYDMLFATGDLSGQGNLLSKGKVLTWTTRCSYAGTFDESTSLTSCPASADDVRTRARLLIAVYSGAVAAVVTMASAHNIANA
jgi:hypothetical protein